jgi:hypothetical protein
LEVGEVSLVDRAANKRRFLLFKQEGSTMEEDILKAVLEADLEDEAQVDEVLKAANISDKGKLAIKGAIRLLQAFKDELPKDVMKTLSGLAGYEYPEPAKKPPEEPPVKATAKGADGKDGACGTKYGPLQKADGTLDLEQVPEELRPTVELLFKAQQDAVVREAKLETILKAERDLRLTREFVTKAEAFSHLPIKPEEFGPVLKTIQEKAPEAYDAIEQVLKAADALIVQAGAFKARGSDATTGGKDAWTAIETKARALLQKADNKLTLAKAVDQICQQEPALYAQYLQEQRGARAQ